MPRGNYINRTCLPTATHVMHVRRVMDLNRTVCFQISTLVQHRAEHGAATVASEKALRAIGRVGQSVNLAMERFVAVADKIGDDNPDIKQDMYDACKEARAAGERISEYGDGNRVLCWGKREIETVLAFKSLRPSQLLRPLDTLSPGMTTLPKSVYATVNFVSGPQINKGG